MPLLQSEAKINFSRPGMLTLYRSLGLRQGRGVIINVSSMYGVTTPPVHFPLSPYTAAKHGRVYLIHSVYKIKGG